MRSFGGRTFQGEETINAEGADSRPQCPARSEQGWQCRLIGEGEVGRDWTRRDLEVMARRVAFIPSVLGSQWEVLSRGVIQSDLHSLKYHLATTRRWTVERQGDSIAG